MKAIAWSSRQMPMISFRRVASIGADEAPAEEEPDVLVTTIARHAVSVKGIEREVVHPHAAHGLGVDAALAAHILERHLQPVVSIRRRRRRRQGECAADCQTKSSHEQSVPESASHPELSIGRQAPSRKDSPVVLSAHRDTPGFRTPIPHAIGQLIFRRVDQWNGLPGDPSNPHRSRAQAAFTSR